MSSPQTNPERKARAFIVLVSLLIPVVVGILYFLPKPENVDPGLRNFLNYLPTFNALNNGTTAVILFSAYMAIRRKNVVLHRRLMTTALALSLLFLVAYVTYHSTSESTHFGGQGFERSLYYFILLSHILLSAVVVPLVLITYVRALAQRFDRHRKIARVTLPIWLYVAVTGVLVYIMIRPYYPF